MAKQSFLARLRERGWKESPNGWLPPPPGTPVKQVSPVRVKKTKHSGEGMNGLEARYAFEILDEGLKNGEVQCWFFESFRLRLAPKTFYTPDFMIIKADGGIAFKEVKGFLREDASVKFKCAREIYPFFEFEMWSRVAGSWKEILPASKVKSRQNPLPKKSTHKPKTALSIKAP